MPLECYDIPPARYKIGFSSVSLANLLSNVTFMYIIARNARTLHFLEACLAPPLDK